VEARLGQGFGFGNDSSWFIYFREINMFTVEDLIKKTAVTTINPEMDWDISEIVLTEEDLINDVEESELDKFQLEVLFRLMGVKL
jgi:hypothetical protein